MVRAGERGLYAADFERHGIVAVGWSAVGDLSTIATLEAARSSVAKAYPDLSPGNVVTSGSTLHKFRHVLKRGDRVVTYDPAAREYLLGSLVGDYAWDPSAIKALPNQRRVAWRGRVSRDRLSAGSKNSLGSIVTLFQPSDAAFDELDSLLAGSPIDRPTSPLEEEEQQAELEVVRLDAEAQALEFLKDRLLKISPDDMEQLVASLLRAMGYKARVTPKGPDRGRDVIASRDGLGFTLPRIIAEVKHRKESMGSDKIRSFLGGLRDGDCGLYVSTGGFTREARYEADRAKVPLTLVELDDLADLVIEHYEQLDTIGRTLVPLVRVYWPAS